MFVKSNQHIQREIPAEMFKEWTNRVLLAKKTGGNNGKNGGKKYYEELLLTYVSVANTEWQITRVHHEKGANSYDTKSYKVGEQAWTDFLKAKGYSATTIYENRQNNIKNPSTTRPNTPTFNGQKWTTTRFVPNKKKA